MSKKRLCIFMKQADFNRKHDLFFANLGYVFEIQYIYWTPHLKDDNKGRLALHFLETLMRTFTSCQRNSGQQCLFVFTDPEFIFFTESAFQPYSMLPFRLFFRASHLASQTGQIEMPCEIADQNKAVQKSLRVPFFSFHLEYCYPSNYPQVELFRQAFKQEEDDYLISFSNLSPAQLTSFQEEINTKGPRLISNTESFDFFILFTLCEQDPRTDTLTCVFVGRDSEGKRKITRRKYQDLCFYLTLSHRTLPLNVLACTISEFKELHLPHNLCSTQLPRGLNTKMKAFSNPCCPNPTDTQKETACLKFNYAGRATKLFNRTKAYVKPGTIQPYRFWNCCGPIAEAMLRESLYCGMNKETRRTMGLQLLKIIYLGGFTLHGEAYYAVKNNQETWVTSKITDLVSNLATSGPDILICAGMRLLEENGLCNLERLENHLSPVCIKHLEEEEKSEFIYEISATTLKGQYPDNPTKLGIKLCELMKEAEQKALVAYRHLVSYTYIGCCSLNEKLSEPEKLVRLFARKTRLSQGYDLVSFPPFMSAGIQEDDTEDESPHGGTMLINLVKPTEKIAHATFLDFSSYYPSTLATFCSDQLIGDCMNELILLRQAHKNPDPRDFEAKIMERCYKELANILTGCQKLVFPDDYHTMTRLGRETMGRTKAFFEKEMGKRVIYGHTDSIVIQGTLSEQEKKFITGFVTKELGAHHTLGIQTVIDRCNFLKGHRLFGLDQKGKLYAKALYHHEEGFPLFFRNALDKILFFYLKLPSTPTFAEKEMFSQNLNLLDSTLSELLSIPVDMLLKEITCSTTRKSRLPEEEKREEVKNLLYFMTFRGEPIPVYGQPLFYVHVRLKTNHSNKFKGLIWESPDFVMKETKAPSPKIEIAWDHYFSYYFFRVIDLIFAEGRSQVICVWAKSLKIKIQNILNTRDEKFQKHELTLWDQYFKP